MKFSLEDILARKTKGETRTSLFVFCSLIRTLTCGRATSALNNKNKRFYFVLSSLFCTFAREKIKKGKRQ